MSLLRIYFSSLWRDSATPWALCDESGTIIRQGVSPLTEIPKTGDCIGILASDRVLMFTAPRPPGNKRRWQTALPFIAEQYSLSDPEDIHPTPLTSQESGQIVIAVTGKSWLKHILAATNAAGLPLRRLISETLMPELQDDSWTLVWNGQDGFLRTTLTTGGALDRGTQQTPPLALLHSLKLANNKLPRQIELRATDSAMTLPNWDLPVAVVQGKIWDWRSAPISDAIPNLLCGDLSPPIRLFDGLTRLRPALFILLIAFSIEVAGSHIEWLILAQEKQALNKNIEHVFHGVFGEDSALIDAPLQMQRNRAALRHAAGMPDDTDFIPLLDIAAPSLGSSIRSLNYESGKLELDIKLSKSADFDILEKNLQRHGLIVRARDMHDTGDGTQARMTLTRESLR